MDITVGSAAALPRHLVEELACYRHRVFIERLGWQLPCENHRELDEFDQDDTVYVIARDAHGRVIGCARLIPTAGPYLLADVFPELLHDLPPPRCMQIWELSRFAAVDLESTAEPHCVPFASSAAVELLRAVIRGAAGLGVQELVTVSPLGVERLLRKGGFKACRMAGPRVIDGASLFACRIAVQGGFQ